MISSCLRELVEMSISLDSEAILAAHKICYKFEVFELVKNTVKSDLVTTFNFRFF